MIRRKVETKEKSLKRTYRENHKAFRAFLAYRRKKIELKSEHHRILRKTLLGKKQHSKNLT